MKNPSILPTLNIKEDVLLLLLGLFVHIVFLSSIFDIYFTSPLVHGMSPIQHSIKRPAKRLVLFSLDGLRADKCFEKDEHGIYRTPFLRSIIESRGTWGVSHTRVPTESRPGHVAMIAGFYEDVSAITKGWQENPVMFDSVFNQSTYTWAFGSPEIIPSFSSPSKNDKFFTKLYNANEIDFAHADPSQLDVWVFDKFNEFILSSEKNSTLKKMLMKDGLVFFLHLIGIDTIGHGYRPDSTEYLQNIRLVDEGIKNVTQLINTMYNYDNMTAFVVTSDHGMTQWGTHGAGHDSETLTPLVVWGAGVNGPKVSPIKSTDRLSIEWDLAHLERHDVSQGDIAPLMATLIGIPLPLNSEGILPLPYMNMSQRELALSLFTNAKQIMAQFILKEKHVKEKSLFFQPFHLSASLREDYHRKIVQLLANGLNEEALKLSHLLISSCLDGLRYYHTYKRFYLSCVVILGFIGWLFSLLFVIVKRFTQIGLKAKTLKFKTDSTMAIKMTLIPTTLITFFLIYEGDPIQNFLYSYTSLPFMFYLIQNQCLIRYIFKQSINSSQVSFSSCCVAVLIVFVSLELIVLSFFYRSVFFVLCLLMGMQPLYACKVPLKYVAVWIASVVSLGLFPLLPVVTGAEFYNIVYCSAICCVIITLLMLQNRLMLQAERAVPCILIAIMVVCLVIKYSVVNSIQTKQGLPALQQTLSWLILIAAPLICMKTSRISLSRLFSVSIATLCIYLLMSISYDFAFYFIFIFCLISWVLLEIQIRSQIPLSAEMGLSLEDCWTCLVYLIFVFLSFFGTGNIASVNTFNIASLHCFATVLSQYVMGALLLTKIGLPLLILNMFFSSMKHILKVPTAAVFMMVLVLTDLLSIHFFLLVRDNGSWLDIGTSISHFVIVLGLTLFLLPIFHLSQHICGFIQWPDTRQINKIT